MLKIIARRVFVAIPTLVLVTLIVFGLQKILPGDPLLTMAGEERDPQVLAFLREKYRLDDPFHVQFFAQHPPALALFCHALLARARCGPDR